MNDPFDPNIAPLSARLPGSVQGPHVGLVPYALRPPGHLAKLPLDALDWPLGTRPEGSTVSDLGPEDHILVHPNTRLHFARWGDLRCKVSLLIAEPAAIHGKHLRLLRLSHRRFHRILTLVPSALKRFPEARLFITGASFLVPHDMPPAQKTADVSLIASGKRKLEGQRLRHALVDRLRAEGSDVAIMGAGYAPFEKKQDGLAPFRYSFVIENVREPSHFTEKIIDACLCRTVPIYWGAPDIAEWFDPDGLIICRDLDALHGALAQIGPEDFASRQSAIERNHALALSYADTETRAARLLLSDRPETPPFPAGG